MKRAGFANMPKRRQRGVAVITALLLTTLAITIVASLFWQQQVQVRSIENQRLQSQKEWILRGALDWARMILNEDAKYQRSTHLGAPWATPLEPTKLDQYVEDGAPDSDASQAELSGSMVDAQSFLNLGGLARGGTISPKVMESYKKLLSLLGLPVTLASATAELMVNSQRQPGAADKQDSQDKQTKRPVPLTRVEDLLAVPGITPEIFAKLRPFVIFLPVQTPVNVNTASAEVLAASIETLSLAEATAFMATRKQAFIQSITGDLAVRMPSHEASISVDKVSVNSSFFLVNGNVRLGRAALQVQSLIQRNGGNSTVIWTHEN